MTPSAATPPPEMSALSRRRGEQVADPPALELVGDHEGDLRQPGAQEGGIGQSDDPLGPFQRRGGHHDHALSRIGKGEVTDQRRADLGLRRAEAPAPGLRGETLEKGPHAGGVARVGEAQPDAEIAQVGDAGEQGRGMLVGRTRGY